MKMFLVLLVLLAAAFAMLGISILLKKNGRFLETHIGRNKEMRKRGIYCVQSSDAKEREEYTPVESGE